MVSDPSNTVELKPSILQVGAEFDCCPGREVQVFSAAPAHNGRRRVSGAVATRGTERVGLEPSRLDRLGRFEPGESRRTDWLLLRHFVVKATAGERPRHGATGDRRGANFHGTAYHDRRG